MIKLITNRIANFNKEICELKEKGILTQSKFHYLIDSIKCYFRYGASPRDYILIRMYNKVHEQRKNIFCYKKVVKYLYIYNDFNSNTNLVEHKNEFNKLMHKHVKRDWIFSADHTVEEIICFLQKHNTVFYKPIDQLQGIGIKKVTYSNEAIEELSEKMKNGTKFLLEEPIKQHHKINAINPNAVSTIRAYTATDREGNVHYAAAYLRTATGKECVDNFSSGGIAFPIDVSTGIIYAPGNDTTGTRPTIIHPETGVTVVGTQIPHFEKILPLISECQKLIPQFRWIGWDIAITEDGIDLVEANLTPCHYLLQLNDIAPMPFIKKHA